MKICVYLPHKAATSFPRLSKFTAEASPPAPKPRRVPSGARRGEREGLALGRAPRTGSALRGGRAQTEHRFSSVGERLMYGTVLACAVAFASVCAAVPVNLAKSSAKLFDKYGAANVIFGREWSPVESLFGLLPMLISTVYLAALTAVISFPVGVCCALWIYRYCSEKTKSALRGALSAVAAIPSVVFGLFGLSVVMPTMEKMGLNGHSAVSASVLLSLMTMPTLVMLCLDALESVKPEMYEAARSLGVEKEYAAVTVELLCAKKDIAAACSVSCARAVAEATAVLMISGNQTTFPTSPLNGVRTLAEHILLECGYASGEHRMALMTAALLLCVMSGALCVLKIPLERKQRR